MQIIPDGNVIHIKRFFTVIDGIIGGDGDGPAAPDCVDSGVLIGGFNPVAVDCVAARLMGFDPRKIATPREAFAPSDLPLTSFSYDDITVRSSSRALNGAIPSLDTSTFPKYRPHFGWVGHIEWDNSDPGAQKHAVGANIGDNG